MPRRTFLRLGGAAIAASPLSLVAAQAGPKGKVEPKHKARAPTIYVIGMKDMAFSPIPTDLHVGDTIEWVNDDIFVHTATAKNKSFDVVLQPKTRGRTVLAVAGFIPFVCRYHPGMKGVLVVTN